MILKLKTNTIEQPIIIIQDASQGSIVSTTDDILNQLELYRYSPHLKGIDIDQFIQMTGEQDFKRYGIRKQKDCRRLSMCAESIRRSSLSSSISSATTMDSSKECSADITNGNSSNSLLSLSTLLISDPPSLRRDTEEEDDNTYQPWPNSIIQKLPPTYSEDRRRYSLPSSAPPIYANKQRRHSMSEEGQERLPGYTCTVERMGKAVAKLEYTSPGKRALRRPWKDVYMELRGTSLKIYTFQNKTKLGGYHYLPTLPQFYAQPIKYTLLHTIPLANAVAELAPDYSKRNNVFRITSKDGPQLLIQVQTNVSVGTWMEKIGAAANIAVDLEHQRMPSFSPVPFLPYHGWESSSTRQQYQRYASQEMERRNLVLADALI